MERKIGEIFEYNGEWYQCIIGSSCKECDFISNNGITGITCDVNGKIFCTRFRKDRNRVVFKKLEKVGEPFKYKGELFQNYKRATNEVIPKWDYDLTMFPNDNGTVAIEIKQNKEDMEEKKQKLDKLVKDYSYNRIPYEVFDNCLKQLYVDKQIGENNPSLKEFDLEAAKAGKPVCTRDGRQARIICFDRRDTNNHCIVALIEDNKESIRSYYDNGKYLSGDEKSVHDLMMLPEKKEGWVNVYMEETNNNERLIEQVIYKTRKDAFDNACPRGYKATVKIEWEE